MSSQNFIYLRDSLNYDSEHPEDRNNLFAFSPDILPLYQTKIKSLDRLTETYTDFIAQTVVPEEENYIYLRGRASNTAKAASNSFTVLKVANELILWPQVLKDATNVGKKAIKLEYSPGSVSDGDLALPGVTASLKNDVFKPENRGARHDALLVYSGDNSFTKLPDAKNPKQLLSSVGSPTTFAFLNARIADPVFDVYSWSTRLRFFDDSGVPVRLELDIESIGIPNGLEASMYSSDSRLTMSSTPIINGQRVGTSLSITGEYDSLITIQIVKTDPTVVLPNYASVSLVANVIQKLGKIEVATVLGAEHLLFDESIRLARSLVKTKQAGSTVEGFYFRADIGDTNVIPRTGPLWISPDVQPYGTTPDGDYDIDFSPQNYDIDISTNRGTKSSFVSQSANYIYLRGNTTIPTHVELSLYAIPNNLLIYPANYGQHVISEVDVNGNKVAAIRDLVLTKPGPCAVDNPFNFFNPVDPKTLGSDHYCLIGEARLWAADPDDKPLWPHQVALSTGSDIVSWILNTPTVANRNNAFVNNPDAATQDWQVNITVPAEFPTTTRWHLEFACTNMPVGGFIAMSATGNLNLNIGKTPITNANQVVGVKFTGVQGPYPMTVTFYWWQGTGTSIPADSNTSLQGVLRIDLGGASALASTDRAQKCSPESLEYPLVIGPDYPNLRSNKKALAGWHHPAAKGDTILGKAHPIQEIKAPGRYEDGTYSKPVYSVAIGGDGKRFY
ncbi:hypothetical protein SERLA73DRAFT_71853 [Serpula lacrymans var. lacrymans S7.3]|uniref:Uncharacterized protein n=2 Tax=Serpula lacrymans var. lacrymans TaxID=341189 RepID=F8PT51_SERL3|nr:uncharacterized protein SERLADRAFT_436317 [Serpula lacrymans var. lacrymans S7.9]EGO00881.1 hypothetical protein SERLA73DRAFT_71853 [Serpula lacrymans var. lacrymans S7.3]EGO26498.1 hypothetical protein SERLADRAFT_436317 [Serpula lacrymans var. lacrymans S7.9]